MEEQSLNLHQEVYELVSKYYRLLEYRRKIDDALKEYRTQLLKLFPPNTKHKIGEFTVHIKKYKQSRLDTKKLKEFLEDSYNDFLIEREIISVEVKKE